MFLKNFQLLFFYFLVMGSLISISSNSWLTVWLGLELNLMSMIPLMLSNLSFKASEASIKYFLAQAMGSILMIFFSSLNLMLINSTSLEVMEIFIALSLALKAGLAPLHFWFPQVCLNLNWAQCFLIFSWQKVAPLILISSFNLKIILFLSIFSALAGALGGFNQLFMKIMLTYSSIAHSAWMLTACFVNFNYWLSYFFFYCVISLSIITYFFLNQIKNLNQIFLSKDSNLNKIISTLNIFSLGGLPPLLGFSAKLSIIISLIKFPTLILFPFLISSSLISLFFYTRVIYSNFLIFSKKMNIYLKNKKHQAYIFSFSLFLNCISPLFFILG